jgi:hypothetical protein
MRKRFTLLIALLALTVSSWAQSPTVIEWTSSDLETVNVRMGNNSTGESQTIKGITVTNNAVNTAGQYCHFMYDTQLPEPYCNFSMSDGGSLTFAPESGTLTSIVIHCDMYPSDMTPLATGWEWDGENMQLIWTGNAASVLLHGNNSSTSFTSGPITLIEFTVSGFVPTSTVTWTDFSDFNVIVMNGEVEVGANQEQTVNGITVSAAAPTNGGASISGNLEDGGSIMVVGDGSLTFTAPENNELRGIVITGSGCNSGYSLIGNEYLSEGWSWDGNTCKLTWSGDAAASVELACTYEYGNINFSQIESIVFTVAGAAPAPDPRKVPDLRVDWNYISEATIIKDMYGGVFEPGTSATPKTTYPVYVYEDFDGNGHYYVKQPSELDLEMTYSVTSNVPSIPNEDVITLTETSGNSIEFDYRDDYIHFGDAEITISTAGNEVYQPASITFTIHVIEGKATTRECVLAFDDGSIVPDDYEFNMETGEEFVNLKLREKVNPYHPVYAPSFSIWGSKNYYVASLAGEKKLRALTAGTDTFTVRYARYETGDAEGKFKILKFPVHIKSSKPALTSSLSLATSPASSASLVCNAEYDGTEQALNIKGALTNEEVRYAMANYAYGSPAWEAALPNTISFELAAGEGDFSVTCQVLDDNYEVRVMMFGDVLARHYDNPTLETHNIHYNIATQKAVVIYVADKTSPNPAPRRTPAATKDAPLAMLKALDMTPTYPIAANLDPDNAGVYYSTHFNETQKYRLPVGTEAYVATISGEDMNLTKVADGGQVIPANTALILKSNSPSVILTPTDDAAVTVSAANDLLGTDSEKTAPANCYVLSGHSTDNNVTGVGFYQYSGTLAAHKAYIIYGGGAGAPKRMRFIFNTPTGLENGKTQMMRSEKLIENGQLIIIKNGVRYNAQGQIVK